MPESDIKVTAGQIEVQANSVNVRDFAANIGVMPVSVADDPVVLHAGLSMKFDEADDQGAITLEQLNDPFLNDALSTTQTASSLEGVLPIQHSFCSFLAPGADPRLAINFPNVFQFTGSEQLVTPNGDFAPLEVFESLSNVDVLGYLDALSTTLNNLSKALDFAKEIPFVGKSLSSLIDVGAMIDGVIAELTNGTEVFFENFQDLVNGFANTFGMAVDALNLRCDPATNAVLMDLNLQQDFSVSVPLNFGGALEPVSVTAGFDAELLGQIAANLTIGFDFNATRSDRGRVSRDAAVAVERRDRRGHAAG